MSARRLALLDVDGTLTSVRSVWQHLLESTGTWAGEGERNLELYLAGGISYAEFCHRDAALLTGRPYAELVEVASRIPLNVGVPELLGGLRDMGFRIVLVSTGLGVLTSTLSARFPVDDVVVNDLETSEGLCTGRAVVRIDEAHKGIRARQLIQEHGSVFTVAVGDGSGDVPMFREVDLAIAVGASAERLEGAHHRQTDLDLRTVLELIRDADAARVIA
jgi:phosphoserine phosphatase